MVLGQGAGRWPQAILPSRPAHGCIHRSRPTPLPELVHRWLAVDGTTPVRRAAQLTSSARSLIKAELSDDTADVDREVQHNGLNPAGRTRKFCACIRRSAIESNPSPGDGCWISARPAGFRASKAAVAMSGPWVRVEFAGRRKIGVKREETHEARMGAEYGGIKLAKQVRRADRRRRKALKLLGSMPPCVLSVLKRMILAVGSPISILLRSKA